MSLLKSENSVNVFWQCNSTLQCKCQLVTFAVNVKQNRSKLNIIYSTSTNEANEFLRYALVFSLATWDFHMKNTRKKMKTGNFTREFSKSPFLITITWWAPSGTMHPDLLREVRYCQYCFSKSLISKKMSPPVIISFIGIYSTFLQLFEMWKTRIYKTPRPALSLI
jgi:hypothetical protein